MRYCEAETGSRELSPSMGEAPLYQSLEPVIKGMGMSLIELSLFRQKERGRNPGSVQVRAIVYNGGVTGVDDCARAHRGILPRLELAFPGKEIYLEVSSPGISRIIKDGREFAHYLGRGVSCYRSDVSGWTAGILTAADENGVTLRADGGEIAIPYEMIAKARLDDAPEQQK